MRAVYKYPLEFVASQSIALPIGAKPLSLQLQNHKLCMWVEVDEGAVQTIIVSLVGTGEHIPPGAVNYVGTVQIGVFVWHAYTSTLA